MARITNLLKGIRIREQRHLVRRSDSRLRSSNCGDSTTASSKEANCVSAVQNDYNVILVEDAHSTFDRDSETAAQIIERHNKELGSLLANLKKMKDLPFVSPRREISI